MNVGDVDTDGAGRPAPTSSAPRLEWISDRGAQSSRVTVFDPRPARLDAAWIEVDAAAVVAVRAMR